MKPREYQRDAIEAIRRGWDTGDLNQLLVLATGLGKTIVFSVLGREMRNEGIGKVLVLAHRNELLQQAQDKWMAVEPGANVGIYQGSRKEHYADVICASIQSCYPDKLDADGKVVKRGRVHDLPLKQIGLIIVDECHHLPGGGDNGEMGSYIRLIETVREHNPDCLMLGVTATPYRADGRGMGCMWNSVAYRMGMSKGIESGFLSSLRGCRVELDLDLSTVKTSKTSGDFVKEDLARVIDTDEARAEIVKAWLREAGPGVAGLMGRRTVAFTPTVASAQHLSAAFRDAGVASDWISGEMPKADRKRVLEAYQGGHLQALVNCSVLTEGWDAPETACVLIARPTKSVSMFCLDDTTEILTERGWLKRTDDLPPDTMVAGFNTTTGAIGWEPWLAVTRRPMRPDEQMFGFASPSVDLRVTDQHRMVRSLRVGRAHRWLPLEIETAESLARRADAWRLPVSGLQDAPGLLLTDAEIAFIGWVETDGTHNKKTRSITLFQAGHQPQIENLKQCLVGCGFKYGVYIDSAPTNFGPRRSPIVRFSVSRGAPRVTDRHLRGWSSLEAYIPKVSGDSALRLLEAMDERQWDIFLEAMHFGDGSKQRKTDGWTRRSYHIAVKNRARIDWLQSMCVRRGWRASVAPSDAVLMLHARKESFRYVGGATSTDRPTFGPVPFAPGEMVWCVEVPSGAIVTRRNGKVAIVGNCQMVGRGTRLLGQSREESIRNGKPDCLIMDCVGATSLGLASMADLSDSRETKVKGIDPEEEEDEVVLDPGASELPFPLQPSTIKVRGCSIYEVDLFGGMVSWAKIRGCRVVVLDRGHSMVVYPGQAGTWSAIAVADGVPTVVAEDQPEHETMRTAEEYALTWGKGTHMRPSDYMNRQLITERQCQMIGYLVADNQRREPSFDPGFGSSEPMVAKMSQPQASLWISYLKARIAVAKAKAARAAAAREVAA